MNLLMICLMSFNMSLFPMEKNPHMHLLLLIRFLALHFRKPLLHRSLHFSHLPHLIPLMSLM
uniref:Uncharacterized protein n=1 Tax=Cucumis melo TaxID=3656 RepID=A0A9I9E5Q7_CUCME